ncbi:MAG: biopolymer transporter ExbD [Fulvimarina manganoxydans]|uniref:ExbD/TolR family protein n=1 Tax=Fulvimarina manganoxydans TaxID=937218 RepID=UPI002354BB86|nr:biopolymer transporter ExbD [Fulvimarina manganoxydans]MCK5932302.1 biopolymer transporter ExbD [Fulvimarina manganoxydans]
MQLNRPEKRRGQDPTIALINIVFLMLIFFLLAGTIASRGDGDIEMIRTSEAENSRPPAGPIGITAEGEIHYGGETVSEAALLTALRETRAAPTAEPEEADEASAGEPVSIVADRALPARDLIAFLRTLREAGLSARIVTRSGGSL